MCNDEDSPQHQYLPIIPLYFFFWGELWYITNIHVPYTVLYTLYICTVLWPFQSGLESSLLLCPVTFWPLPETEGALFEQLREEQGREGRRRRGKGGRRGGGRREGRGWEGGGEGGREGGKGREMDGGRGDGRKIGRWNTKYTIHTWGAVLSQK